MHKAKIYIPFIHLHYTALYMRNIMYISQQIYLTTSDIKMDIGKRCHAKLTR